MITVEVIHGLLKNVCSHILYYIFIAEVYTRMGFEEIFVILTWIKKSLIYRDSVTQWLKFFY